MVLDIKPLLPKTPAGPVRICIGPAGATPERVGVDLASCRRILVVKLDHIGDWVLCTPFLENLRRSAPRAEISAFVLPRVANLASSCLHVDHMAAIRHQCNGVFEISAQDWAEAATFRRDYANGAIDLAIVPRWDADFDGAARIAWGSGARFIVGFSERCTRRKRVINRGHDRFYTHVVEDRRTVHEVEHNFALLEAMNARVTTRTAVVQINAEDDLAARRLLASELGPRPQALVGIAPFAAEPKRTIPIPWFAGLAGRIADTLDFAIVVVGGPDDRLKAGRLARLLRPRAVSAAGRLTIREAAALIRHCDALIGVDSGLAHLAAAVGTPVAVLSCHPARGSPNHANSPARFAPWGPADRVLVVQPTGALAPCRDCCQAREPHCILGIDDDAVARLMTFIGQALSRHPDRRTVWRARARMNSHAVSRPNDQAEHDGRWCRQSTPT